MNSPEQPRTPHELEEARQVAMHAIMSGSYNADALNPESFTQSAEESNDQTLDQTPEMFAEGIDWDKIA